MHLHSTKIKKYNIATLDCARVDYILMDDVIMKQIYNRALIMASCLLVASELFAFANVLLCEGGPLE